MSAAEASRSSELDSIDRGLIPGSLWKVFTGPPQSRFDAILEVNVIQPDGSIGYTLYTSGVTNLGISWRLTHQLNVRQFLANISNEYFVRV